jgi:hypothetical protein
MNIRVATSDFEGKPSLAYEPGARAVMDAAGVERAAIMGVSEGGSLAALFAASHPERCSALILYGSFAKFSDWFPTK